MWGIDPGWEIFFWGGLAGLFVFSIAELVKWYTDKF
jgi:hypothetical protein